MAKIRHIAYRATDVDAMAKFFVDAMGMKLIQKRKNNAIDLSDGSVNITVLPLRAGTSDGAPTKQPASITSVFQPRTIRSSFVCWKRPGAKKAGTVNLGTAYYEDKFVALKVSSSTSVIGRARRRSISNSSKFKRSGARMLTS